MLKRSRRKQRNSFKVSIMTRRKACDASVSRVACNATHDFKRLSLRSSLLRYGLIYFFVLQSL